MSDGKIDEIINSLKNNPVFNMSLSSKELFHSNVLAWLLEDTNNGIPTSYANKLIEKFKPNVENWEEYAILTVLREKNNFDLLIIYYNKTKKNQDLEYVVIENKFKAVPDENQLNRYTEEIFGIQRYGKKSNKGNNGEIKIKEYKRQNKFDFEKKPISVKDEILESKTDTNNSYIPNKKNDKYLIESEHTTCYLFAPERAKDAFLKRVGSKNSYISKLKNSEISMLKEKGIYEKIEKEWFIVTYNEICSILETEYKNNKCLKKLQNSEKSDENEKLESELYTHKFIDYYTKFVNKMLELSEIIFSNKTNVFPNEDDIKKLKRIRIHDFYEKLWYSNVLSQIDTSETKKTTVEYSNGTGMLNFYYYTNEDEKIGKNYGIEIQSKTFRFFCWPADEEIYDKLSKMKHDWLDILEKKNMLEGFTKDEDHKNKFNDFKYDFQTLPDNCTISQLSDFLRISKETIDKNM